VHPDRDALRTRLQEDLGEFTFHDVGHINHLPACWKDVSNTNQAAISRGSSADTARSSSLARAQSGAPDLPPKQRAKVEELGSSTRQVGTTAEEFRATPETTAQVRSADGLGGKPLAVVSAGEQPPGWLELRDELAALLSNSSHDLVDEAAHVSLLDERRDPQVTSAAILEVVEAMRNDQPIRPQNP
jgi:hypothetical protein